MAVSCCRKRCKFEENEFPRGFPPPKKIKKTCDFQGDFFMGLDLVWESATPPNHIWETFPKNNVLFLGGSPRVDSFVESSFPHILLVTFCCLTFGFWPAELFLAVIRVLEISGQRWAHWWSVIFSEIQEMILPDLSLAMALGHKMGSFKRFLLTG